MIPATWAAAHSLIGSCRLARASCSRVRGTMTPMIRSSHADRARRRARRRRLGPRGDRGRHDGVARLRGGGRSPRPRPGRAAVASPRSCWAGRSSPCRRWPCSIAGGWWWWAVRRVDRDAPHEPGPALALAGVRRGPAGPRVRPAVRDRPLRHDPVLGPHGPARAADPDRGAAHRPGRPGHDGPPCLFAGHPATLDPAGAPFAGGPGPGLPGRRLAQLRGRHVGRPLLATLRRGPRGPARP